MKRFSVIAALLAADAAIYVVLVTGGCSEAKASNPQQSDYVVLGYNDLGMHCLNQNFSELCVLPPANTLRAQVIDRSGEHPQIVTSGIGVTYSIPGNTRSVGKTNFWQFAYPLFGVNLPDNMGLFGFGLAGDMRATPDNDFIAQGIPITQVTDAGVSDCYQLSEIVVWQNGLRKASTQAVVPVSWEMKCVNCHRTPQPTLRPFQPSVESDILKKHDRLHGTSLYSHEPVLCASCHADPALGAAGAPGMPNLSSAMHTAHASRMGSLTDEAVCYSCHPGPQTQCLRDVHKKAGLTCTTCHAGMTAVGNPVRRPWQDEPRCDNCHHVANHQYEQAGVLFRDSVGHNGVKCIACHGSPHAITPTLNPRDNVQAIAVQGYEGTISKCTVCHRTTPTDPFNHTRGDN